MIPIHFEDPSVQSALIGAVGSIVAAIFASIAAAIIGRQFTNRARLKEKLAEARSDIAFLMAVEAEHCEIHKASEGKSLYLTARDAVRSHGFTWSGRHTPGRIH